MVEHAVIEDDHSDFLETMVKFRGLEGMLRCYNDLESFEPPEFLGSSEYKYDILELLHFLCSPTSIRRGVRSYAQCGCNVLAKF